MLRWQYQLPACLWLPSGSLHRAFGRRWVSHQTWKMKPWRYVLPLSIMPHTLASCIKSPNLAFGWVLYRNLWRITHACTLTWEGFCLRDR